MGTAKQVCVAVMMKVVILALFAFAAVSADIGSLINAKNNNKFTQEAVALSQFKAQKGKSSEMIETATAAMEAGRRLAEAHSDSFEKIARGVPTLRKAQDLMKESGKALDNHKVGIMAGIKQWRDSARAALLKKK